MKPRDQGFADMRTALKPTEMVHASFVNAALSEDRTKLASSMISVGIAESADSQPTLTCT
jgi:hypothetical protein